MIDLSGKKALVTGARGGLGAAIAREFAARNAHVAVSGRNEGDCAPVVDSIEGFGGRAFDLAIDVSDLKSSEGRLCAAVERLGGLDILVNNAAVIEPIATFGNIDPLAFDHACRANLSGAMALTNAAWRELSGGGRVLNILTGAATNPLEGWAAYCASKAGLHMLTQVADQEGRACGIRCFGFSPGMIDTAMQAAIRASGINPISEVPRDQLSSPSAPAEVAAWLVSGEADALAGTMVGMRDRAVRRGMGWEV